MRDTANRDLRRSKDASTVPSRFEAASGERTPVALAGSLQTVIGAERKPVDIVVPVYKSVQLATRCLESLAAHIAELSSANPRLIAINDSPGDHDVRQMLEEFAKRCPYLTVLENQRNLGFVKTVNKGLTIAQEEGRDVILVNADTETFPETLKNLTAAAYSDPQIGFASPRSNNASLCSLPHVYGGAPATSEESYQRWKLLSRTMPPFHFVPTAVGFYLYIKNAVIANFGLLDSDFGVGYEEENDLILRANKVGYRAVLVNNAFAYHVGAASFSLTDIKLKDHKQANLKKMTERHPEFLPLVRRYEASAHYRAERLLSHTLPLRSGQLKLVFDLSSVGAYFNGTNEMAVAVIEHLHRRHSSRFEFSVVCREDAFRFHKLDRNLGLRRHDVDLDTHERFAIAVQLGQPFSVHAVSVLEDLAAINVFGMLDTIADDCGYLSVTHRLDSLWGHVTRTANGLFFNSKFSEQALIARYPDAKQLPRYAQLLPTGLDAYAKRQTSHLGEHVLIMGNHFAHKASGTTAELLRAHFPTVQFVVLGATNAASANVRAYQSGALDEQRMESLYLRAAVVVLPSHVEGFGFGLLHALAAGKVVVARDIPATREVLSTYQSVRGVFLYSNDCDLVRTLQLAMKESSSQVDDGGAHGWDQWVDGFAAFCASLVEREDLFERLTRRIEGGDVLRKLELLERLQAAAPAAADTARVDTNDPKGLILTDPQGRRWTPARHINELLRLDGEEFVQRAYVTVFNRLPDVDGLGNYLEEMKSGISKFEVLTRLRSSVEGRKLSRPLAGYTSFLVGNRLRSLLSFRG